MLPEIHKQFFAQQGYLLTPEQESLYLQSILTHGAMLPEPELQAPVFHMPGCVIGDPSIKGPYQTPPGSYLFISVAPEKRDYINQQHFSAADGPSIIFRNLLLSAGFSLHNCYFTCLARFIKPANISTYKHVWLKIGLEYVHEEIKRIKPTMICLLGTEVLKVVYRPRATLDSVQHCVLTISVDGVDYPCWAMPSQYMFAGGTSGADVYVQSLRKMLESASGGTAPVAAVPISGRDYRILDTPDRIAAAVAEELARGTTAIAIDVETATDTGRPDHEYIVSFQWSHGPRHGRVIPFLIERPEPLREDGTPMYGGAGVDRKSKQDRVPWYHSHIAPAVKTLLDSVQLLIGHNIRYDLSALQREFGCDARSYIYRGIFDTMQACHALEKNSSYSLKHLAIKYSDLGAYSVPLLNWCDANAGPGKLFYGNAGDRFFHGYRDVAYAYLLPYAMCDVDATFQLYLVMNERLKQHPKLNALFHETLMPLNAPVMDVERFGFILDKDLAYTLSRLYTTKYQQLQQELCQLINWPDFNINSPIHMPALLYRGPFKHWKRCYDARPAGAYFCDLMPAWETGPNKENWCDIPESQREFRSPSCEIGALRKLLVSEGISDMTRRVLEKLIEVKSMKQFVSLFMRLPDTDPPASEQYPRYGKGILGCVLDNGRVCTRVSLLSETHRWTHQSPNLANIPKTKEDHVKHIFIAHATSEDAETLEAFRELDLYSDDGTTLKRIPKVREMFKAAPGWKIIEADYKSAELWVMGYLSQDKHFCHVLETEPDAHGYNAKHIFKLDCDVKDVKTKYPKQRFAAKAVCFGIAYGLSGPGLADQLSLEYRRPVSADEAQEIIDGYFAQYPDLKAFFERCKQEVEEQGYVETPFGSRRYFPGFHHVSRDVQSRMKREAMNAKIQGTVAIMLDKASILLDRMRYDTDIGRKIQWEYCLGLHDAIYVHTPAWAVETTAEIVKWALESVIIPGVNRGLQAEVSFGDRWGAED